MFINYLFFFMSQKYILAMKSFFFLNIDILESYRIKRTKKKAKIAVVWTITFPQKINNFKNRFHANLYFSMRLL